MNDIDIWRTATLLIKQLGEGASFNGAQRANALFAKDDFLGAAVWPRDRGAPTAGPAQG